MSFEKKVVSGQPCLVKGNIMNSPIAYVIVPGNPSILELYEDFANQMIKRYPSPVIISSLQKTAGYTITLSETVELKKRFFEDLFATYPNTKFIIFAHSIGNYISLNALKQLPSSLCKEKIIGFYSLFPALKNMYPTFTTLYRVLTWSYLFIYLLACLTHLMKVVPLSVVMFVFNIFSDVPHQYIKAIKDGLTPEITGQMLSLCKEEGVHIKEYQQDFIDFIQSMKDQMHFVYGKHDVYGDETVANEMMTICQDASFVVTNTLHAFVLGYVEDIVDIVAPLVRNNFRQLKLIEE
ncbi:hypothetical protein EIN_284480 [Entamoeba invadens IP1]|uniref:Uncharacterized protein n=1 Tax=Entamoeba invadens IP1 TaxID=370355 RepID=L7FKE3_ENTIV|nr:hypothetical protein EIN_284480 [Entamoeba invadens IP1]ELP84872.1 hypothetical protein EIN_284480 [Entamoeba invadens IP1]|eukprot:XP_004184218.1 hypothetical protein EIN_284480 [Entamoeba invadens IP1]